MLERRPSTSAAATDTPALTDNSAGQTKPEISKAQKKEEEEDDWLAGVLSRKKSQSVPNSETKSLKREDPLGLGEEVDLQSNARYCLSLMK